MLAFHVVTNDPVSGHFGVVLRMHRVIVACLPRTMGVRAVRTITFRDAAGPRRTTVARLAWFARRTLRGEFAGSSSSRVPVSVEAVALLPCVCGRGVEPATLREALLTLACFSIVVCVHRAWFAVRCGSGWAARA